MGFIRQFHKQGAQQKGLSLVSTIVSVGVLGIMAAGMSKLLTNSARTEARVNLLTDLGSIKASMIQRMNCRNTFNGMPTPIAGTGNIEIRDADNRVILPSGGQFFGKWHIRATLESIGGQNGLSFYATRPKVAQNASSQNDSDFYNDPMTSRPLSMNNPRSKIFPDEARPCLSYFRGVPGGCSPGEVVVKVETDGTAQCRPMFDGGSCSTGQSLVGYNTDGSRICRPIIAGGNCSQGQPMLGLDPNGRAVCAPAVEANNCPAGTTLMGFDQRGERLCGSIQSFTVQRVGPRGVTATCPQGTVRTGCSGMCNADSSMFSGAEDNQANGAMTAGTNGCVMLCDDPRQTSGVRIQAICTRINPGR